MSFPLDRKIICAKSFNFLLKEIIVQKYHLLYLFKRYNMILIYGDIYFISIPKNTVHE